MSEPGPPSSPAQAQAAQPHSALYLGLRLLIVPALVLVLLLLVLAAVTGTLRWMLVNEAGTRWLLTHVPGVETRGFEGALFGDHWRADRMVLSWAGGKQSITLEGLAAEGLQWTWRPSAQAWIGLDMRSLKVRRAVVLTGPPSGKRPTVPHDLGAPVQLTLADASIEQLEINQLAPLHGLVVQNLAIDPRPDAVHRVQRVSAEWHGLLISAGARIGHAAPLTLQVDATLTPAAAAEAPPWAAVLRAHGPLAQLAVEGTLRGVPRGGREAPAVDLRAALAPFEAWPVNALSLATQALDLSAIHVQAPQTRLTGQVELRASASNAPLTAHIAIDNSEPGRWNERRLPLRRLVADLRSQFDQRERLDLQHFDLDLADGSRSAGHWRGSASWHGPVLKLQTQLVGVAPNLLDSRAAAMTLSGPLNAMLHGLPSPDAMPARLPAAPRIEWQFDLEGRLAAAPQSVRLAMEGNADDQRLELKGVRASAGTARATLKAVLHRAGRGDWKIESSGNLVDFDPQPWWPGEANSAWRRGRHRLSGDWQFDLRLPGDADRLAPIALAQRLVGNGTLQVRDSMLAGVPFSAEARIGYAQSAAPTPATLRADLNIGGNLLSVEGRGDPTGAGTADHLRVELKAESLTALAPLARLHPALADWVPRQGVAHASIAADGRWPALRIEGNATMVQLAAGPLTVARGQASWRMDSAGAQPLSLLLDVAGLQYGKQRADSLHAELRGTLAEHRIEIAGAWPILPPALAVQLLGAQSQSGSRAQLLAQGGWQGDPAGGGRWRARVERLTIGSWDGGAGIAPSASNWAEARDLQAEVQFDVHGELLGLHAAPGRLQLGDALALRWDEVRVDLSGARPQIELHADIEAFNLAPLLARAQPGVGWQGDLRLAARVDVRAADRFEADLVFERREGDLGVQGADGLRLLGLSELRLALAVHDGNWTFTPHMRGRSLGEIDGSLLVRSTPEQRWPGPGDRIDGNVVARVADIGIWRAWIPAGWQLGGEMRTAASLSGTFGNPRYSGYLSGSGLAVRNALEGVNVSDGQISLRLEGDNAQVERFTLRGGEGSLSVTGGATLGGAPQARLQVKADHFRLLGRVDRMLIVSGGADLQLSADAGRLDGVFAVDEGLFDVSRRSAPTLDADVTVRRPDAREDIATDIRAPRTQRDFALGLDVELGDKLSVRGRGVDTLLRGKLRVSAPDGRLAVNGTIRTEGGTYAAYGQKLEIDRGILAFSGEPGNPRLDVLALRPNIDTRAGVQITGYALTPRVRLYSEPDMSDIDKLSWLILGRAPDGLGRNDATLLQRAALAVLAGEGEAPTDGVLHNLGIDELSLRQAEGDTRETVVTLGKQLSRNWYVGYERGINASAGTWQLIYRLAQRFTVRLQSGLENSLDVIWVLRVGESKPVSAAAAALPASAAASAPPR